MSCVPDRLMRLLLILLLMTPAALVLPTRPAKAQQWQELTCESWNWRDAACPIPGGGRVTLGRVFGGECIEGRTWIQDGALLRVRGGCRASFRVESQGGWNGGWNGGWGNGPDVRLLRCESWNWRDAQCPVAGRINGARLVRVIAGDCRDGQTWRWDRRALYVRAGCRADFEVQLADGRWGNGGGWSGGGNGGGWNTGDWAGGGWDGQSAVPARITCESWNWQPARCAVPGLRAATLERVIAGDCRQGRSWGYGRDAIWVTDGCRARFLIH